MTLGSLDGFSEHTLTHRTENHLLGHLWPGGASPKFPGETTLMQRAKCAKCTQTASAVSDCSLGNCDPLQSNYSNVKAQMKEMLSTVVLT